MAVAILISLIYIKAKVRALSKFVYRLGLCLDMLQKYIEWGRHHVEPLPQAIKDLTYASLHFLRSNPDKTRTIKKWPNSDDERHDYDESICSIYTPEQLLSVKVITENVGFCSQIFLIHSVQAPSIHACRYITRDKDE